MMKQGKQCLPGIEFEGPLGMFWDEKDVPLEALIEGVVEIWRELLRRGYKEEFILEATRAEFAKELEVENETRRSH